MTILGKIILPLSKPASRRLAFFTACFIERVFQGEHYLTTPNKYPIQLILRQFVVLDTRHRSSARARSSATMKLPASATTL